MTNNYKTVSLDFFFFPQKSNKTQSRIDKWKMKHEAMLKMAASDKEDKKETPEDAENKPTLEITKKEIKAEEVKEEAPAPQPRTTRSKSADKKEEESNVDDDEKKVVDLADLASAAAENGVCIELKEEEEDKTPADDSVAAVASSKPHTRHSATVQQALSV